MKIKFQKKAVSTIIATVLLISLVLVIAAVVWAVAKNMVEKNLDEAESCIGIFDKVKLNELYTCYDSKTTQTKFSVEVGEVKLDKIIVSVSGSGIIKKIELNSVGDNNLEAISSASDTKIPSENSGKTYKIRTNYFNLKPDRIEIIPFVDGNSCGVVSIINSISDCSA